MGFSSPSKFVQIITKYQMFDNNENFKDIPNIYTRDISSSILSRIHVLDFGIVNIFSKLASINLAFSNNAYASF